MSKMAISAVLVMSVWAWVWAMGLKVRAVGYPYVGLPPMGKRSPGSLFLPDIPGGKNAWR